MAWSDNDNIGMGTGGGGFFQQSTNPWGSPQAQAINAAGSKKRATTVRSSNRSGRYGNSVSRRSGGISQVPAANPGPVQPVAPDINTFLNQDTGYQQQLRDFANALSQFSADVTRRKGSLESEYGLSSKAMNDQKVLDLDNLEDNYGARGILRSGLYGKAVGDYNTEFNTRFEDLTRRQKEALGLLEQEKGRFTSQQDLQKQSARESAIRRRAEQYGV